MKPFALDTVLSYRQRLEDTAKNNLAKALLALQQAEERYNNEQHSYRQLLSQIDMAQQEGINITDLIRLEEHLAFIKNRVAGFKAELQKKEAEVAKIRQELLDKSRERQVMDKLREKQNLAYKQHLDKKEAANLDEIAIIFHNK